MLLFLVTFQHMHATSNSKKMPSHVLLLFLDFCLFSIFQYTHVIQRFETGITTYFFIHSFYSFQGFKKPSLYIIIILNYSYVY